MTPGDIVVLRHTLEHVAAPVEFLHAICEANGFTGKILIEVPRFEWIVQRRAFWDIFHEHCNYFTESSIAGLFDECSVVPCFEDQYMWIIADINKHREFTSCKKGCQATVDPNIFSNEVERLKKYVALRPGCLIWGAGAKGIAFANQVDPQGKVLGGIVDISPKKQGRYAAKSGHLILSPDELRDHENADIIIMNENYKDEIQAMCERNPNALLTLGEI
ncbi:MAG: hypothetical protein PHC98_06485 [Syntrophotalea acetylenica]|nr:hypothetical protein [Syntrophotalea acetylenica]